MKRHEIQILNALKKLSTASAYGIAAQANIRPDQVFRRMKDLQDQGLIVFTGKKINGPNGCPCKEWKLNGESGWGQ